MAFHGLAYLAPRVLVVAWPLEADVPTAASTLEAERRTLGLPDVPPLAKGDLPEHGLWLDAFMQAADDLATDTGVQEEFKKAVREGQQPEAWLAERARETHSYTGPTYPDSLRVRTNEALFSAHTRWHVARGGMTLELGLAKTPDDGAPVSLHEWPCGCFGPPG